jgi:SAM-dependent methyltransferase
MSTDDLGDERTSEYTDAEAYDAENCWSADDDFYLALAQEIGDPVLDVGCGTGRLTRAIAQAGLEITGFDLSPQMLARARELSDGLDIDWVHGDVRSMRLGRRFRLILMTGHAFQHMMTDDDLHAFFERMREHLVDEGVLAFETRNFAAKTFGGTPEPTLWHSYEDRAGRWIDVNVGSVYDPETGIEQLTFIDVVRATGERTQSTSALRYVSVEQLNRLLREHGFDVVAQYGDWHKGPLGPAQPEVVTISRLAARL